MAPFNKLFLLLAALVVSPVGAAPAGLDILVVETRIEHAYLQSDDAAVKAAAAELDGALVQSPGDAGLRYERGFAGFAAAAPLRHRHATKADVIHALESAETTLGQVHGMPWEAEAEGLRADLLGELISLKGGLSGMSLGPKSSSLLKHAGAVLPHSPRILLFQAQAAWSTPKMFGGDPAKGAALFQAAADRFAAAGVGPEDAGPRWGQVEALRWLGIVKRERGDANGARAAWERALALEPQDGWVKFALLPSLGHKKSG